MRSSTIKNATKPQGKQAPGLIVSETAKCRDRLAPFCQGYGIDIGYGGDPIVPWAITMDLPQPYTAIGDAPLNLGGNAKRLWWFTDESLDFVFSSHLLEDFKDTRAILIEWLRVLAVGGHLIIYGPVEQIYREHCKRTGHPYNESHKIEDFSLPYVENILAPIGCTEIIHSAPLVEEYSFELVAVKKKGLFFGLSR